LAPFKINLSTPVFIINDLTNSGNSAMTYTENIKFKIFVFYFIGKIYKT
jgi:hypothetical protein